MMSNVRARKIIHNIDSLIDACVFGAERKMKWTNCVDEYVHMMVLLTLHRNLTGEEVNEFQRRGGGFFSDMSAVLGNQGHQNYMGILAALGQPLPALTARVGR